MVASQGGHTILEATGAPSLGLHPQRGGRAQGGQSLQGVALVQLNRIWVRIHWNWRQ